MEQKGSGFLQISSGRGVGPSLAEVFLMNDLTRNMVHLAVPYPPQHHGNHPRRAGAPGRRPPVPAEPQHPTDNFRLPHWSQSRAGEEQPPPRTPSPRESPELEQYSTSPQPNPPPDSGPRTARPESPVASQISEYRGGMREPRRDDPEGPYRYPGSVPTPLFGAPGFSDQVRFSNSTYNIHFGTTC